MNIVRDINVEWKISFLNPHYIYIHCCLRTTLPIALVSTMYEMTSK